MLEDEFLLFSCRCALCDTGRDASMIMSPCNFTHALSRQRVAEFYPIFNCGIIFHSISLCSFIVFNIAILALVIVYILSFSLLFL